jgi:hypothetical protein
MPTPPIFTSFLFPVASRGKVIGRIILTSTVLYALFHYKAYFFCFLSDGSINSVLDFVVSNNGTNMPSALLYLCVCVCMCVRAVSINVRIDCTQCDDISFLEVWRRCCFTIPRKCKILFYSPMDKNVQLVFATICFIEREMKQDLGGSQCWRLASCGLWRCAPGGSRNCWTDVAIRRELHVRPLWRRQTSRRPFSRETGSCTPF